MMSIWNPKTAFFGLVLSVCCVAGYTVNKEHIAPGWADKKVDIYFILDSSSSIYSGDFQKILDFVSSMVNGMDIGPSKTRVGVGMFSYRFQEYLPIANDRPKDSLVNAILDTPDNLSGVGYISRALNGMRRIGLSPNTTRKGVPRVAVLFTDGESRSRQLTLENSALAKKERIFLYTIGIGTDVDGEELRSIASDPKNDFAFRVPNFASFHTIKDSLMKSMADVEFLQGDEGKCGAKEVTDIVFVFDEYAMGQKNSQAARDLIKYLVQDLSMDSGKIRVGVYSKTCHKKDITLGEYLTRDELVKHLDDNEGPTIASLMKKVRLDGFGPEVGGRGHAKRKRMVLILHGDIKEPAELIDQARRAKYRGRMEIFIIDTGSSLQNSKGILEQMASGNDFIVTLDSMEHTEVRKADISQQFCGGLP